MGFQWPYAPKVTLSCATYATKAVVDIERSCDFCVSKHTVFKSKPTFADMKSLSRFYFRDKRKSIVANFLRVIILYYCTRGTQELEMICSGMMNVDRCISETWLAWWWSYQGAHMSTCSNEQVPCRALASWDNFTIAIKCIICCNRTTATYCSTSSPFTKTCNSFGTVNAVRITSDWQTFVSSKEDLTLPYLGYVGAVLTPTYATVLVQ